MGGARRHSGGLRVLARQRAGGRHGGTEGIRRIPAEQHHRRSLASGVQQVRTGHRDLREAGLRARPPVGVCHLRHPGAGPVREGVVRPRAHVPRRRAGVRRHVRQEPGEWSGGRRRLQCRSPSAGRRERIRHDRIEPRWGQEDIRGIAPGRHHRRGAAGGVLEVRDHRGHLREARLRARPSVGLCELRQPGPGRHGRPVVQRHPAVCGQLQALRGHACAEPGDVRAGTPQWPARGHGYGRPDGRGIQRPGIDRSAAGPSQDLRRLAARLHHRRSPARGVLQVRAGG
mmetsp:Transcript_38331/g.119234  ORF Transcript_38331/g.119234 Transcript_38331/m.119234 type:complete len:286 (+) Transcript_38331:2-859(+)